MIKFWVSFVAFIAILIVNPSRFNSYLSPIFPFSWQGMFVPAIKGQGTDEQHQKWLPLAYKMQIIGCYAQTELGHGSNVQGLETTATFDPQTDEFVIHSPTLTSSKVSKCIAFTIQLVRDWFYVYDTCTIIFCYFSSSFTFKKKSFLFSFWLLLVRANTIWNWLRKVIWLLNNCINFYAGTFLSSIDWSFSDKVLIILTLLRCCY